MSRLSRMTDRSEGEPVDRLGRIAAVMLKAAEEHPEFRESDRAIVMLDDHEEQRGMLAHGGYQPDEGSQAFVNLLAHVQVLAESNGLHLDFVPNPKPIGRG